MQNFLVGLTSEKKINTETQKILLMLGGLVVGLMVLVGASHAVQYVTAENMYAVGVFVSIIGLCLMCIGVFTLYLINKASPIIRWDAKRILSFISSSAGGMVFIIGILMVVIGQPHAAQKQSSIEGVCIVASACDGLVPFPSVGAKEK